MYFNSPPNISKGTPAIKYLWDANYVHNGVTGVFRPESFADSQSLQFQDFGQSGNLGSGLNDSFVFDNSNGYSTIGFHLDVPSGGQVSFEGSFDGFNWNDITVRQIGGDGYITYESVSNGHIGSISSLKYFRARTSIPGSGVGSVIGRASSQMSVLEGIEHGFAPHRIGFTLVHKDFNFASNQSATPVWIPQSGKKFVVTDLHYSVDGSNSASIVLFDGVFQSGNIVSQLRVTPPSNQGAVVNQSFSTPFVSSQSSNSLKITTSGNPTILGVIHGYEIFGDIL